MTSPDHALLPALAEFGLDPAPPPAEREARLALLDTLACMLAGANEPQTRRAVAAMRAEGVSGPSRAVVCDSPLPAAGAALLNGVAAHALDYDDYESLGATHPSAALISALLAAAEARPSSLAELARAYMAGYEAIARFGQALGYGHYQRGWHATSTLGPLGAALAVARLRGLERAQTISALSLAASMSAGLQTQFGSDAKAVHAGLAARAGIEAATLAGAGIAAAEGVLAGPRGFFSVYGAADSPGAGAALAAMQGGPAILTDPPLRKPWPSCSYTHRPIAAGLAVAAAPGFDPDRIESADLHIAVPYLRISPFTDPGSSSEARFSVLYCAAAALSGRPFEPGVFAPEALTDPRTRSLMARITLRPYPLPPDLGDMSPDAPERLVVRFTDGTERTETAVHAPGGAKLPLDEAALLDKFHGSGGAPEAARVILSAPGEAMFRWSSIDGVQC